jgi:hypothetical protein
MTAGATDMTDQTTNETDVPWAPGLGEWWRLTNSGRTAVYSKEVEAQSAFERQRLYHSARELGDCGAFAIIWPLAECRHGKATTKEVFQ